MKELGLNAGFTAVIAFIGNALGGWDAALKLLVVLMVIDFVTGFLIAWRVEKNINSNAMFDGGLRKGVVCLVIYIAILLDSAVGGDQAVFRALAIYYYIGREGVSVTENLGKLGVPLPPGIIGVLAQLKKRGEEDPTSTKKRGK